MITIENLVGLKPYSFTIGFNEHRTVHEPIASYYDKEDFVNADEYEKAIETGNVFEGHIYPSNSVGFYRFYSTNYDQIINAMYTIMLKEGRVN